MADLSHLDMSKAASAGSFTPIPAGDYKAMLVHSEVKPTKDGTGQRLALRFIIMEGQYQNRLIFEGLNIVNKKPDTEAWALRLLNDLKIAVGKPTASQSEELHNRPLTIKVAIKDDQNVIKAYKSRPESNAQQQTNMMTEAFSHPAQTTSGSPANPFAKK
jgi:hypothetical protein